MVFQVDIILRSAYGELADYEFVIRTKSQELLRFMVPAAELNFASARRILSGLAENQSPKDEPVTTFKTILFATGKGNFNQMLSATPTRFHYEVTENIGGFMVKRKVDLPIPLLLAPLSKALSELNLE